MSLLLMMAIYVVNFTITEMKISNSQSIAAKTYYLAESGIAEAIWKIKNDATWKTNFEENATWTNTFTRDPAIYSNGSYQIQITNTGKAKGDVVVTAYLDIGGSIAQRVIKTSIYKAIGDSGVQNNAELADGNVDLSGSVMHVTGGDFFANGNIILNFNSVLDIPGNDVSATGNINQHWTATLNAANQYEDADPIPIPAVSFDNPADPNSYLSLADTVYTEDEFETLMENNQNLTLDGITYVDGDIHIQGGQILIINGVLVSEEDIKVGKSGNGCCWGTRCGNSDVTINRISSTTPAGLLAKDRIYFEDCLGSFDANGLVYANDQINILGMGGDFDLTGGLISRKLTLTSIWQGIDVVFDDSVIAHTLSDPEFSPVVTVEHWEEEY